MRQQSEQQARVSTSQQQLPDMGASEYTDGSSFNEDDFIKFEPSFDASQDESISAPSNPVSHTGSMTPNGVDASTPAEAGSVGGHYANHSPGYISMPNTPSQHSSSHRRTESLASIASAASISDIKIEETKTETGVSLDDIAQYITGPDPNDGKWTCIFDDCNKKFGRKENIKSHVQTHLNDRQYQCPTCKKCFVRQHDLKRHAKIHTGIKPYPCECGNSFARHDALTRHRQRGMCIGAFDGIVRKVVKRGRPRKNRPDFEDRLNKSARTRKKNMSVSSVSSQSGYTDSSAGNSPINDFQMLDEMMDMGSHMQPRECSSSAPMPMMNTQVTNDMIGSPSIASPHSYVSPEAIMERIASHPASPAKSIASQYNTPPELSQSSSPPAAHFFEGEPNSSGIDEMAGLTARSSIMTSASMDATIPMGINDHSDDILLQFTNDDSGLVSLDRDPSLMMLTKFDDEFESNTGMFADSDDIFFGTS
jgi:regulatory protein SWI5